MPKRPAPLLIVFIPALLVASSCSDSIKATGDRVDTDRDGLSDELERQHGLDPTNTDSDGDGTADGVEVQNVLDPADHDDDGRIDALDPCHPSPTVPACTAPDGGGDPDGGQLCTPGEIRRCVDVRRAERCDDSGKQFIVRPCGAGQSCLNNACVATPCTPGELVCDGDKIRRCNDAGLADALVQDCDLEQTGEACSGGICVPVCSSELVKGTSEGCEYWAVDLDNAFVDQGSGEFIDASGQQFAVVISNPSARAATVRVCNFESRLACGKPEERPPDLRPVMEVAVEPGVLEVLNLPRSDVQGTVLDKLAYFLTASLPIVAYQFNPLDNTVQVFSNDASLLMPVSAMGNEYLVMTRRQEFRELRGYVTVVGIRPEGTRVKVKVTATTLPGPGLPAMRAGDFICRTLGPYDVLNIETNELGADLTGTEVIADRPIVVFGGSEAADAPNRDNPVNPGSDDRVCCADHLEMQMFPTSTWGREYLCARSYPRGDEPEVWRIMALEDDTALDIWFTGRNRPELAPTLNHRGEWYEFEAYEDFELLASRPVLVGQFLAAEEATGSCNTMCNPDRQECRCRQNQRGDQICRHAHCVGDPAFILVPPAEQFRKSYVILAPDAYELDFVTIVAPEGTTVRFDGQPIPAEQFEPVGRGAFVQTRFQIEDGAHRIDGDERIGVTVYGYDQYVSYGYPGGLNLLALNPTRTIPLPDGVITPAGNCPDDP
jgi:hypothetical protein